MTRPWKVAVAAVAVFGFVYGYAGTAGAPLCGSMGGCIQVVFDAGPPWFYPASLIPGAIAAAIFAAVVYLLFLLVDGGRRLLHREKSGARNTSFSVQPAPALEDAVEPQTERTPLLVPKGPKRWTRPSPLLLAIGAALVYALISVGPANLVDDLDGLIQSDTVSAPTCVPGWEPSGDGCSVIPGTVYIPLPNFSGDEPADLTKPQCDGYGLGFRPESDGMCHNRSGGEVEPLMNDVLSGAGSGLLAFLLVGAALLLWPRLRAAGRQTELT